jgi:hypothetical protein
MKTIFVTTNLSGFKYVTEIEEAGSQPIRRSHETASEVARYCALQGLPVELDLNCTERWRAHLTRRLREHGCELYNGEKPSSWDDLLVKNAAEALEILGTCTVPAKLVFKTLDAFHAGKGPAYWPVVLLGVCGGESGREAVLLAERSNPNVACWLAREVK